MKMTLNTKFIFPIFLIFYLFTNFPIYSQSQTDSSYFPLDIGNKWVYESTDHIYSDTIIVTDTQRVRGKIYYALKEYSYRYTWFRTDNNKVYIVDTAAVHLDSSNIKEYLLYDFSSDIGDKWFVPVKNSNIYCDYADSISLVSKSDIITTPVDVFSNCYCFLRRLPCRDGGRYKEWFTRGVGRISYKIETIHGPEDLFLSYLNIVTDIPDYNNSPSLRHLMLLQNYPNPFNPTTTISYTIPKACLVTLKVYDVLGKEVATLVKEEKPAGNYKVEFDARSYGGSNLPSGVYFYRLQVENFIDVKKFILLK